MKSESEGVDLRPSRRWHQWIGKCFFNSTNLSQFESHTHTHVSMGNGNE